LLKENCTAQLVSDLNSVSCMTQRKWTGLEEVSFPSHHAAYHTGSASRSHSYSLCR